VAPPLPPPPVSDGPPDRKRRQVVERLPEACRADFNRLCKTLLHGPAFQWLLVDAPQEGLRRQVMDALNEVLSAARLRVNRLPLGGQVTDVATLEARLVKNAAQADVVHVIGSAGWFTAERWDAFNVRRERLAQGARARLVFWLDGEAIALASQGAPDLWAWRGGVYAFAGTASSGDALAALAGHGESAPSSGEVAHPVSHFDAALRRQAEARLTEIEHWLQAHSGVGDDLLAAPSQERAELLASLGRIDEALAQWQAQVAPLYERQGDKRRLALARLAIGELLERKGQLAEALRLVRDDVVPALSLVGAWADLAQALQAQAHLYQSLSQFQDALALRVQELSPLLFRLGRTFDEAENQDQIAALLHQLGRDDEALAAWAQAEALFSRLGDPTGEVWVAHVLEASAQLLMQRGELDQALDRLQRALAVYRQHGHALPALWCRARIAEVLRRRGQLDEAERMMVEVRAQARQLGAGDLDAPA